MHARVDEREAVADLAGVALPVHDGVVGPVGPRPVGPRPVGLVDVDGCVERVRKLDHRAVEVRTVWHVTYARNSCQSRVNDQLESDTGTEQVPRFI